MDREILIKKFDFDNDIENGFLELFYDPVNLEYNEDFISEIICDICYERKNIFVALDKQKVVGTITLCMTRTFGDKGKRKGYLNDLIVLPEYRKQGIGKALVDKCLKLAKEKGATHVSLASSDINKEWYEKQGFNKKYYHMVITLS